MKYYILMGSPRKNGNTSKLLQPFIKEFQLRDIPYKLTWLYDKRTEPCIVCRRYRRDWTVFGCHYLDDAQEVFYQILDSDVIVLVTPIYSWFCMPPVRVLLDRMAYGMNKHYGDEKGPSFWKGKQLAAITTYGYRPEKGVDLFEEGIKRYCKHSQLDYLGVLVERDPGYQSVLLSKDKIERSRSFARRLAADTDNPAG